MTTAHGCFGKPRSDNFWIRPKSVACPSWRGELAGGPAPSLGSAIDRNGGWCAYSTPPREADVRGCTRHCRDPALSGTYRGGTSTYGQVGRQEDDGLPDKNQGKGACVRVGGVGLRSIFVRAKGRPHPARELAEPKIAPSKIERFVRGSKCGAAARQPAHSVDQTRVTWVRAWQTDSPVQWPTGQFRCRRQPPSGLAAPWTGLAAGRPLPHASNERQHQPAR